MLDQDVVVVGHITKYVSKYQPVINYTFVLEMLCRYLDILKTFFCIFNIYRCPYLFLIFSEVRPPDHQGFIGFPFAQVQQYLQYLQYLHLFTFIYQEQTFSQKIWLR